QERNAARNAGHAGPQGLAAGADAWVRHRPAHSYAFQRTAAGGRRLSLSGAAEDAAQGLGESRVGHFRNQPQSEVLQTHGRGQETIASGNRGLWTRGAGNRIGNVQSVSRHCQDCQDCQKSPGLSRSPVLAIFGNFRTSGKQRGFMGEFFRRIYYLLNRRRLERELQDDIDAHREMLSEAARKDFGNVALARERAREAWGWGWLDRLLQDLRFGARLLKKSPGLVFTAVIVLALGIGVNVTAFNLMDVMFFKPLRVRD